MNHTYSICNKCQSINKISRERALQKTAICGKCRESLELHGLVSEVTEKDFRRIMRASDLPVIVDFWAPWCGPCKTYGPEFQKVSEENAHAVFLKINTESEQALSTEYGIRGIPCTILFKDGKEVKRQAGAMNQSQINQFIS